MKLKELSLIELKQARAKVLESLTDCNKETNKGDMESARIAARGLEAELADVSAEIDRREGHDRAEAEHAAKVDRSKRGEEYESGVMLSKDQSVRAYCADNGLIKKPEFGDLRMGALLRAMVLGPKNELERRALSEGSDSAGGVSVPDVTFMRFIDQLRAAQVCVQAGARTVPLQSDRNTIARTVSSPVAAWRSEAAPVAESDSTFDGVVLIPRSLAVLVKASRELLEDSLNVEQTLETAFRGSLAVELDRVALRGSGIAPQPAGIFVTDNVNDLPAVGPFTNYDDIIEAMSLIWQSNEPTVSAAVMSPTNLAALLKLKEASTEAYLRRPEVIPPLMQTTSMDDDTAIVGNFSRLIFGIRTALRIEMLKELYTENLQIGFIAHLRADIGIEHPESFTRITNLTAS